MPEIIHKQLVTNTATETEAIGEAIGSQLRGGEMIELSSDLGGGKTTLVRGIARAVGSPDQVASPTFTISKVYEAERFQIHHFDFYRLEQAGVVQTELQELLGDPKAVVIVEWSGIVESVLPADRLTISLAAMAESESKRRVDLVCPAALQYLIETVNGVEV